MRDHVLGRSVRPRSRHLASSGACASPCHKPVLNPALLLPLRLPLQAGVNAAPEAILTSLIRADTASAFNFTIGECTAACKLECFRVWLAGPYGGMVLAPRVSCATDLPPLPLLLLPCLPACLQTTSKCCLCAAWPAAL